MLFLFAAQATAYATSWSTHAPLRAMPRVARAVPLQLLADITYDEVAVAVDKAENLWAAAMDARQKADELSEQAEVASTDFADQAGDTATKMDASEKFSLSMLGDARVAMEKSGDVQQLLADAVEAAEKAEAAEQEAEAALQASEKLLEAFEAAEGEDDEE